MYLKILNDYSWMIIIIGRLIHTQGTFTCLHKCYLLLQKLHTLVLNQALFGVDQYANCNINVYADEQWYTEI